MNILVIGSGGREHAICVSLEKDAQVASIFLNGGNGGNLLKTTKISLSAQKPFTELVKFGVENSIDLVVPGSEIPLVEGIQDAFRKVGIPCFGPSQSAARLEGSKAFSKDFMQRHYIPTAQFKIFTEFENAKKYVESCLPGSIVIKVY
jgi:phosphoribosylamine--glycine ligase / phosphoribosylformylglycinamidine cyclo-ligase